MLQRRSFCRATSWISPAVRECLQLLTPREREVLALIVIGKPNKVMASDLGVSQRTVEIHRARVMEKMQAGSVAQLVRMALAIEDAANGGLAA
jgi:two-component system, LuxR family, response regulator FixJ